MILILLIETTEMDYSSITRRLFSLIGFHFYRPFDDIGFVKKYNIDAIFSIDGDILRLMGMEISQRVSQYFVNNIRI